MRKCLVSNLVLDLMSKIFSLIKTKFDSSKLVKNSINFSLGTADDHKKNVGFRLNFQNYPNPLATKISFHSYQYPN